MLDHPFKGILKSKIKNNKYRAPNMPLRMIINGAATTGTDCVGKKEDGCTWNKVSCRLWSLSQNKRHEWGRCTFFYLSPVDVKKRIMSRAQKKSNWSYEHILYYVIPCCFLTHLRLGPNNPKRGSQASIPSGTVVWTTSSPSKTGISRNSGTRLWWALELPLSALFMKWSMVSWITLTLVTASVETVVAIFIAICICIEWAVGELFDACCFGDNVCFKKSGWQVVILWSVGLDTM